LEALYNAEIDKVRAEDKKAFIQPRALSIKLHCFPKKVTYEKFEAPGTDTGYTMPVFDSIAKKLTPAEE
jgi:hypothetical protein